jgi:hypothetical protein
MGYEKAAKRGTEEKKRGKRRYQHKNRIKPLQRSVNSSQTPNVRGKSPAQQEKSVSWERKKRECGKRKPKRASQTKAIANSGANSYDPGLGRALGDPKLRHHQTMALSTEVRV